MESIDIQIEKRVAWASHNVPGFGIFDKQTSPLMKTLYYISFMFLWNKTFMTDFTTTIGARMYIPRPISGASGLALLNHEIKHMEDSRRFTFPIWILAYLFPQSLALLAFGAFWSPWFLIALGALAPLPAPFRVWAEKRGYTETYRTLKSLGLQIEPEKVVLRMREVFCGWSYYRMSWSWKAIRDYFWDLTSDG